MQKKKGISLIVLIITIVVMVTLTTAIVLTLNNTGIIEKANEATAKTNLAQIQQAANLIWADAFMEGKRDNDLKDAVINRLAEQKIDTTGLYIYVTNKGVTVTQTERVLNEYGFYYNQLYILDNPEMPGSSPFMIIGVVLQEDKLLVCGAAGGTRTNGTLLLDVYVVDVVENVNYAELNYEVSEDGRYVIEDGEIIAELIEGKELTGLKIGEKYIYDDEYIRIIDENKLGSTSYNSEDIMEYLYEDYVIYNAGIMGSAMEKIYVSLYGDSLYVPKVNMVLTTDKFVGQIIPNKLYKSRDGKELIVDENGNATLSQNGEIIEIGVLELTGVAGSGGGLAPTLEGKILVSILASGVEIFRIEE